MSNQLSKLTLGCWALVGGQEWGDQEEALSIKTIHAALDHGIQSFDTAPMYGKGVSERILGKALIGRRDQVFIADKISPGISTKAAIAEACEVSLGLLQTDVIDLMQIHWPDHEVPFEETIAGILALQEAGKIKHIGVCNFSAKDMVRWKTLGGPLFSNQLPYSLLSRSIEFEIIPQCLEDQVGVLAYSPIMQGLLTGKFKTADEVPDGRARSRHFNTDRALARHGGPGCEEDTFAAIDEVRKIAEQLGVSMTEVALAWVNQQPAVKSTIVGARTPQQIIANIQSMELQLTDEILASLDRATDAVKSFLGPNPDLWAPETRYSL
ncbi:MAG: aldo/keto reductase [Verrucomicrobia bacterium]|nr:aldo/keto reductase [Verrucomicrobiota bacterium]MDA1068451.1 aldo/keto reductase [Verrucomicrobiota bacterium]